MCHALVCVQCVPLHVKGVSTLSVLVPNLQPAPTSSSVVLLAKKILQICQMVGFGS